MLWDAEGNDGKLYSSLFDVCSQIQICETVMT
jgi:hypothetical protein